MTHPRTIHACRYTTDDIRISVVYRARCFRDAAEASRWADEAEKGTEIGLETILTTLAADLVARGRIVSVEAALALPRLQLAERLLKEYVAYPLPPTSAAWVPVNYCALPKLAPWTAPFMRPFC